MGQGVRVLQHKRPGSHDAPVAEPRVVRPGFILEDSPGSMNDAILEEAIPLLIEASRSTDPVAAFLDLTSREGGVASGDFIRTAPGRWSRAVPLLGQDLAGVIRLLTLELSRFRGRVNTEVVILFPTPWDSHASPR